jgi:hypothetical protein
VIPHKQVKSCQQGHEEILYIDRYYTVEQILHLRTDTTLWKHQAENVLGCCQSVHVILYTVLSVNIYLLNLSW